MHSSEEMCVLCVICPSVKTNTSLIFSGLHVVNRNKGSINLVNRSMHQISPSSEENESSRIKERI